MPNKKQPTKAKNQTSIKGKLVEMIVASMHANPQVTVESNVRLPALRNPTRKREIDILISGFFSGYPIKIAIECKNHNEILDIPYMDAYIGKLQDIGIPTQSGIYVSVAGFTEGALERAKEVGITPLILTGLTPDHLAAKINEAIQSVVYLLAEITSLEIRCNVAMTENSFQLWFLYDDSMKMRASIPDLIWKKWVEGRLPSKVGKSEIEVEIPAGWKLLVDGKFEDVISAKAKIQINALVINMKGQATQHALINPVERTISRFKTNVSFDLSSNIYPINMFSNEDDLENFMKNRPESFRLSVERIRLPRIRFYLLYWPLSARAVTEFIPLVNKCIQEKRLASNEELSAIEGNDLKTIWDPIWDANPLIQEMQKQAL